MGLEDETIFRQKMHRPSFPIKAVLILINILQSLPFRLATGAASQRDGVKELKFLGKFQEISLTCLGNVLGVPRKSLEMRRNSEEFPRSSCDVLPNSYEFLGIPRNVLGIPKNS